MIVQGGLIQSYMDEALNCARVAYDNGDVPVGAIIVKEGNIIAKAYNRKEKDLDVLGHAEVIAIKEAVKVTGDWRLNDCTMICTLEPCPMCAGTMLQARLGKLVYGAYDLKWGAHSTKLNLLESDQFNHQVDVMYFPDERCSDILKSFFKQLRT